MVKRRIVIRKTAIMGILIAAVLGEVNKPHAVFSIGFYKDDGSFVKKNNVTNRRKNLNEYKKMNRSGLLNLYDAGNDQLFSCTIDLIMTFNGTEIIRPTI